MAYVPVPSDLSRIKTKLAFNLTKRQLICFSIAGGIGIPFYLFTRSHIGNSTALFLIQFTIQAQMSADDLVHMAESVSLVEVTK